MNEASDEILQHVPEQPPAQEWGHLDPSRWWFASSAFPMIAATLGPVASSFSICALVKPWRQSFPPGTNVDLAPYISDPRWLTAINAVQLLIAVAANMALFLNMTRRLSFTIAQPLTIVGWYISSIALVALTATASGPLVPEPADDFIWSQAFYYAIYSAVLYFVVASLMVVTYLGAQAGHYPKDFMLTPSQRTLMLQTIMFQVYLLLGALIFCRVEGWSYLDAVYWAAVTLFTVGFGDFYATTTLGRALLMPYALIGIISLGLVIGSIRSLVLDRGKRRLGARMVEKKRRRTLRRMTRTGKDEVLIPIRDDPPTVSSVRTDSSGLTEFERREREFNIMRKIQEVSAHRRRWVAMGVSSSTWLVLWLAGAKVFQECEERYQGWTYFDGFYFAFVSLTTIGYGDITPVSNAGKSFWVFWALLALPTMTVLISNAGDTIVKGIRDATDQIATVTILPSEQGFKKDLKRLLRTLSCGVLFEEDIEQEPAGFLGQPQRLKHVADDTNNRDDDDDAEETMHQDEADLESEAANTAETKQKRAARADLEEGHSSQAEANAAEEENEEPSHLNPTPSSKFTSKVTFSTPSPPRPNHPTNNRPQQQQQQRPNHPTRTQSIPRQHLPLSSIPSPGGGGGGGPDYHITLVDEIRRVTQHLKHHPPRKYTFHEWAWYLRLIGEDEADAGRHRREGILHGRRRRSQRDSRHGSRRRVYGGGGGDESGGGGEGDGGVVAKGGVSSATDTLREGEGDEVGEGVVSVGQDGPATGTDGGEERGEKKQGGDGGVDGDGDGEEGRGGSGGRERGREEAAAENPEGEQQQQQQQQRPLPWSWVGSRSPLMGSQEEAEWILERLIARLGDELRGVRDERRLDQ